MSKTKRLCEIVKNVFAVPAESVTEDTMPENVAKWNSLRHIFAVAAAEYGPEMGYTPKGG